MGFACTTLLDCMYAVVSVNSMVSHAQDMHGVHHSPANHYWPAKVQDLFSCANLVYIEVDANPADSNISHDKEVCCTLDSIWILFLWDSHVYSASNDHDMLPFIQMTPWDQHFPHVREQHILRKDLLELRASQSPKCKTFHRVVLWYLMSSQNGLTNTPMVPPWGNP